MSAALAQGSSSVSTNDSFETAVSYVTIRASNNNVNNNSQLDDDHDADNNVEEDEGTTALQTLIHLIKGYIGPGCLSLPWAFSQLGILYGCFACITLSCWSSYLCLQVVHIKRSNPHVIKTYPDVGIWAYGPWFGQYIRTAICVQQLAICTVFFSFIGENLLAIWENGGASHALVMTLALPAILGLSCLADLKAMTPFTAAGTILLFGAFGLLGAVMAKDFEDRPTMPPRISLQSMPLALCAILYSFEGVCLILPIEGAMMAKRDQFQGLFVGAMTVVAITYCTVASSSVYIFGRVTNGSITAFLLEREDDEGDRNLLIIANTAVSLSVLLTYPLQLFPCLELVTWPSCFRRTDREPVPQTEEEEDNERVAVSEVFDDEQESDAIVVRESSVTTTAAQASPGDSPLSRLGLVLLTYTVAIAIPNVQALISLAGALAGSSTALLIPPLLQLEYVKRHCNDEWWPKLKCYLLFALGFIFMCIGTGASIMDIVNIYKSSS